MINYALTVTVSLHIFSHTATSRRAGLLAAAEGNFPKRRLPTVMARINHLRPSGPLTAANWENAGKDKENKTNGTELFLGCQIPGIPPPHCANSFHSKTIKLAPKIPRPFGQIRFSYSFSATSSMANQKFKEAAPHGENKRMAVNFGANKCRQVGLGMAFAPISIPDSCLLLLLDVPVTI